VSTKLAGIGIALVLLLMAAPVSDAQEKKREGRVVGVVQGQKDSRDGKNTFIDVLAPGEERARSYHVLYDAEIKGPIPSVLKAVRAAKVGDRVELEWVETGHGPAIKSFQVLKSTDDKKTRSPPGQE